MGSNKKIVIQFIRYMIKGKTKLRMKISENMLD